MIYQRGDRAAFVVLVCWAIAGCHRDGTSPDQTAQPPLPATLATSDAPPSAPAVEWYRAVVGKNLEAVPFFVGMPPPGAPGSCSIINGEEHIAVDCHWQDASTVELEFPVFATSIHATRQADGSLLGVWHPSRLVPATLAPTFAAARIPRPDPALRFPARFWAMPPVATGDFAGTWRFQFEELAAGKGTFRQTSDGVVTGTIIPEQIGDFRYMAGNARGSQLLLSTFDGQHAYVVRATLDPTRNGMRGTWTFAGINRDGFTASRVPSLDIALVEKLRLKDGAKGVTIPQLDDPRYRGKPVIVDYFGTWCPACMDEMPFLLELYRRHHAEGLEILSIALEGTTDEAYNQRQVDYFRTRYAIPWQIVIVPGDYDDSPTLLPPELDGTGGYPITIFLEGDRTVHALHSGFFGPAAGDDFTQLTETFERYVNEMLATTTPR